jgi:hypothetical protein
VGGENATLNFAAGWSTNTPFAYAGNMSLNTNGVGNATVSNPSSGSFAGPFTLSTWVSWNGSLGGAHYVFDTGGDRHLFYFSNGSPTGDAIYWDDSSHGQLGTDSIAADDWTHFAFVSDGTFLDVYQDGILQGSVADDGALVSTLFIGSRLSSNEFWRGQFDEFAIWESALSGDNIEWLSQNSISQIGATAVPEPASLVLWAALGAVGLGYCVRRRKVRASRVGN